MNLSLKFIHPSNNSDIDIDVPDSMFLRDIFAQLIEHEFLSPGQPYTGSLKSSGESVLLDNNRTLKENEVPNNATIQIVTATPAGLQGR